MLNDQLIAELPQLLDLRVPYFDPSFEAMIRMQSKFAEEGYEKLSGVQRSVFLICNGLCFTEPPLAISRIASEMITQPVNWMPKLKVSSKKCGSCQYAGRRAKKNTCCNNVIFVNIKNWGYLL